MLQTSNTLLLLSKTPFEVTRVNGTSNDFMCSNFVSAFHKFFKIYKDLYTKLNSLMPIIFIREYWTVRCLTYRIAWTQSISNIKTIFWVKLHAKTKKIKAQHKLTSFHIKYQNCSNMFRYARNLNPTHLNRLCRLT